MNFVLCSRLNSAENLELVSVKNRNTCLSFIIEKDQCESRIVNKSRLARNLVRFFKYKVKSPKLKPIKIIDIFESSPELFDFVHQHLINVKSTN